MQIPGTVSSGSEGNIFIELFHFRGLLLVSDSSIRKSLDRYFQRSKVRVHERHRSPYPSPSRSPWRPSKSRKERKLRGTEWEGWTRNGTELGWSDPTFAQGSVPKVNRRSIQPNKNIPSVRAVR